FSVFTYLYTPLIFFAYLLTPNAIARLCFAIALTTHKIGNAIPTERFAIALKTHNTGNAIPTEHFAIAPSCLKKYY
ncbi:hypothetical protein QHH11_08695, partial [Aphanizomenon sp. PH219]|nr:hypothetical protein [Aphanizomenon sp. 202]MDK2459214.1 hypothetical protein [Aphanizomenon sp. PH219]